MQADCRQGDRAEQPTVDAQKTVALGEAENASKKMQQEAKAQLFELAVKAFGDPTAYTKWQFAQGLPDDIDLKMIYSGRGTLRAHLKGLVPVLNVKAFQRRQVINDVLGRRRKQCAIARPVNSTVRAFSL
jgi:hypothetical protein